VIIHHLGLYRRLNGTAKSSLPELAATSCVKPETIGYYL
jgi:hypothetical protein